MIKYILMEVLECPFQRDRSACIARLQELSAKLTEKAFEAIDSQIIANQISDTSVFESEAGSDAAVTLALDLFENKVAVEAARTHAETANHMLDAQEFVARGAREDCSGVKLKRKWLIGAPVAVCTSESAKCYVKGNGDRYAAEAIEHLEKQL